MKGEVNQIIQKYGPEDPPPPPQVFSIKNVPGDGNIHLVQKVFKGEFEVCTVVSLEGSYSHTSVRHFVFFWLFAPAFDM